MDLSTLYGNTVPSSVKKQAEKQFNKFAKKFSYDPNSYPNLAGYAIGSGYEDFAMKTVLENSFDPEKAEPISTEKSVMIGTIRMGFGHCRMAIALASAAKALGYTPYWMDLLSYPDSAGTKTIRYLEKLYNLGSRISQRSRFFNKYIWEYITSAAGQRLTHTVKEKALSKIFSPLYTTVPKDIPFLSTHPWVGHGAVEAGLKNVVTIIPDNFPLAFHVVPGSTHAVQSPSAYMGYRSFIAMGTTMNLDYCMPKEDIFECGHYIDHEIVSNVETDCEQRLRRVHSGETRRFLLTMGGAGAQVMRFADIIRTSRKAIEENKAAFFINMGDHVGRWKDLKKIFDKEKIAYELITDWKETRKFIEEKRTNEVRGIYVFLHDNFYAAVYTTNLLIRISDVMITKPSELSFYPIPKLFIQRVGRHEAWGAIRGSEIGDGTIETASITSMHRTLKLLIEEDDLLELYCRHIIQNKKDGIYDGAYNAVRKAVELRDKHKSV